MLKKPLEAELTTQKEGEKSVKIGNLKIDPCVLFYLLWTNLDIFF